MVNPLVMKYDTNWNWTNAYGCVCGEDLSDKDLADLVTTYTVDEKTRLVVNVWWHRSCYYRTVRLIKVEQEFA